MHVLFTTLRSTFKHHIQTKNAHLIMALEHIDHQTAAVDVVDFNPSKMTSTLQQSLDELSLEEEGTQCTDVDSDASSQSGNHFAHLKHVDAPIRRKRSILKRQESSATDYVCTQKKSWKNLPIPDLKEIDILSSSTHDDDEYRPRRVKSAVTFKEIQMRHYDQTLGDHPNTSYGPPITLDWNYEESEAVGVDAYEEKRGKRRTMQQMMMNYYVRKNTLMWSYGHSEEELKKATRATGRVQFQRGVTKYFMACSKVEEVVASAARKTKRAVKRSKSSTV